MTKIIDLVIKNCPDDEAVKTEILTNAETTIKNFHARNILVVEQVKQDEYYAKVALFKEANGIVAEVAPIVEQPVEEVIK